MFDELIHNYLAVVSMVLFGIGFGNLLLQKNLIKKIIGMNIMDTAAYLFLTSIGYIQGRLSPVITEADTAAEHYVNPLPAGLVLTGIVVSVSVTAVMLALTIRIYRRYHTLNLDGIYRYVHDEMEGEK